MCPNCGAPHTCAAWKHLGRRLTRRRRARNVSTSPETNLRVPVHPRPSPLSSELPAVLLDRVRGEFLEMPGLRLNLAQAARLWQLDRQTATALLRALVASRFLSQRHDGSYARRSD